MSIKSAVFSPQNIELGGKTEQIVRGGREKFPLLPKAFAGVKKIGVIGFQSQGPAHAKNLRDSLAGMGITVKVGLRRSSGHWAEAEAAGFTEKDGTLGEMFEVIKESDLVLLLISDAAQIELRNEIFTAMKPGATLGFAHGFLHGYMESHGEEFPSGINVIGVCPKGMGPSVRRLYEQGASINGAGINCSFAIEQDVTGTATDIALGWAIAIGAPYVFETTLEREWKSDLYGERSDLLAGVHGILESLYRYYSPIHGPQVAFCESVESVTGPISRMISKHGIIGLYNRLLDDEKKTFQGIYAKAYGPFRELLLEIYDEVSSGNEIRSVELAGQRLKNHPMGKIDGTDMWKVGERVRAARNAGSERISPFTAGLYCAMMMAQIDVLFERGHCWSEICNESVIEAVDSLNPFMHARGVAYMVDNCSTTARLGSRKWAPRWDYVTMQQILPTVYVDEHSEEINLALIKAFENHPVHDALAVCAKMRPPVNIFVE